MLYLSDSDMICVCILSLSLIVNVFLLTFVFIRYSVLKCLLEINANIQYFVFREKLVLPGWSNRLNTQYMRNPDMVYVLKMEYVYKINIFGLEMMVKSGLKNYF